MHNLVWSSDANHPDLFVSRAPDRAEPCFDERSQTVCVLAAEEADEGNDVPGDAFFATMYGNIAAGRKDDAQRMLEVNDPSLVGLARCLRRRLCQHPRPACERPLHPTMTAPPHGWMKRPCLARWSGVLRCDPPRRSFRLRRLCRCPFPWHHRSWRRCRRSPRPLWVITGPGW